MRLASKRRRKKIWEASSATARHVEWWQKRTHGEDLDNPFASCLIRILKHSKFIQKHLFVYNIVDNFITNTTSFLFNKVNPFPHYKNTLELLYSSSSSGNVTKYYGFCLGGESSSPSCFSLLNLSCPVSHACYSCTSLNFLLVGSVASYLATSL